MESVRIVYYYKNLFIFSGKVMILILSVLNYIYLAANQ